MSYEPTTWAAGDTVTSAKLNKIEQGIVTASNNSGAFVVEVNEETYTLNKKAGEIYQAFKDGKIVYVHSGVEGESDTYSQMVSMMKDALRGFAFVVVSGVTAMFTANSEDDYPVLGQ